MFTGRLKFPAGVDGNPSARAIYAFFFKLEFFADAAGEVGVSSGLSLSERLRRV